MALTRAEILIHQIKRIREERNKAYPSHPAIVLAALKNFQEQKEAELKKIDEEALKQLKKYR